MQEHNWELKPSHVCVPDFEAIMSAFLTLIRRAEPNSVEPHGGHSVPFSFKLHSLRLIYIRHAPIKDNVGSLP